MRARIERYLGIWLFTISIVGFLIQTLLWTFEGRFDDVQRLGSAMVFAGTLSALLLSNGLLKLMRSDLKSENGRLSARLYAHQTVTSEILRSLEEEQETGRRGLHAAHLARQRLTALPDHLLLESREVNLQANYVRHVTNIHGVLNTAVLIGFGTLQWGYGDLASEWIATAVFHDWLGLPLTLKPIPCLDICVD